MSKAAGPSPPRAIMMVVKGPEGAVTVVVVVTGGSVASLEKHEQALLSCGSEGAFLVAQRRESSSVRRPGSRRRGRTVRVWEAVSVAVALLKGRVRGCCSVGVVNPPRRHRRRDCRRGRCREDAHGRAAEGDRRALVPDQTPNEVVVGAFGDDNGSVDR